MIDEFVPEHVFIVLRLRTAYARSVKGYFTRKRHLTKDEIMACPEYLERYADADKILTKNAWNITLDEAAKMAYACGLELNVFVVGKDDEKERDSV